MKTYHVFTITSVIAVLFLLCGASCIEGTEVSGDEVIYSISVQGAVEEGTPEKFTNARGWEVQLTRAQALVGPIYFYSGEARASLMHKLFGINEAYACAAHSQFQSGRTLGELPLQYGVDLLNGSSMLSAGERGEGGEVRSVELHVQNPGEIEAGNTLAASLGSTYEFEGVATRDDKSVQFKVAMTLPEEGTHQIVDSIPADIELGDGSTLHLKLLLDRLFQEVDFEGLDSSGSTSPVMIEPGTQAYTSLVFSLRSRSAFVWENTP